MRIDELPNQPIKRIEPAGVLTSPNRLVVWGIHGAGDYVTGMKIGDLLINRRPLSPVTGAAEENIDQFRERVMNEIVPTLGPAALRDTKGSVVGYFVYQSLPTDHCRRRAYEEGVR